MTKEFKSFDEQIKILKDRHLVIDDEDKVKNILTFHNYYNVINGYKTIFCYYDEYNNEYFFEGTNFDEIYALYCFDRELRSIIFKYTLEIENSLRTIISHTFSKYHGAENYMRYSNFDILDYDSASKKNISRRAEYINELISNIQMDLARSITKKDYINHYIVRYGYVPLWVLVNNISFSRLSTFYKLMKQSERVEVSKY
ncbi:MAG: Abi family protein [Erysipelotrichaceae bacterium]|nr:Abi family protein [Erysipelotrichaceae bacterium]